MHVAGADAELKNPSVPFRDGLALLWSYSRPHLGTLLVGVLLGLFATALTLATPMVAKWVIDSLGTSSDLTVPIVLLVVVLLVSTIATFAQSVLLGRLSEHIVLDARQGLVRRFFFAKLEQIQRFRTGELVTRVTSDTLLLQEATTNSFVQLINGVVSLVGTIVLMAVLDLPLLVITLVTLTISGGLFGVLVPRIGGAEKRAQDAIGKVGASLEGGIRALRTVKSSRAEGRVVGRINAQAEESARYAIRSVWFSAVAWSVAGAGVQAAILIILGIGAGRVALGELAVSTLVAFLMYAFNIVEPISTLAESFTSLQGGLAAAARIRETEHLEQEDTHARPTTAFVDNDGHQDAPILALRDVSATYVGTSSTVLRDVTFSIPRTGHIALVGPSGAGKTTVFSLLLRFMEPTSGQLELDGIPYDRLSIDDVRSRIAYVEQETPIIFGTIRDNVLFRAPDASDDEAWAALAAVRLEGKVRSLAGGLDAIATDTNLSGGQRQRLAIARALLRRPEVLLLDEATAQLDGTTEAAVQRVVADAASEGAVVTIAHRLSTVLDADRIIVFEDGAVRDSGTHRELLMRDALYQEFVAALRISSHEGASGVGTGDRDE